MRTQGNNASPRSFHTIPFSSPRSLQTSFSPLDHSRAQILASIIWPIRTFSSPLIPPPNVGPEKFFLYVQISSIFKDVHAPLYQKWTQRNNIMVSAFPWSIFSQWQPSGTHRKHCGRVLLEQ